MNGKIEKEKISQKYLIKLKYLSNKKGFLGVDNKFNFKEKVVIVPFGLEKTVSYGGGTKNGPKEIIKASHQVELYDEELNCEPYKKIGIKTLETFKIDKNINKALKKMASVNKEILDKKLFPMTFGGEHSITPGCIDPFVKKYKNISQNIAHFGFSLLILSILFNNLFASEIITNLKVGETFENSKTKIVFESVDQKKEKNYNAIIANFSISNLKGEEDRFSPELRIYNQPVIATSEADIKTTLMSDKFIVINLVQNQDFFNVRYQVKPFMLWIWLSVILISFGGIVSFLQKRS